MGPIARTIDRSSGSPARPGVVLLSLFRDHRGGNPGRRPFLADEHVLEPRSAADRPALTLIVLWMKSTALAHPQVLAGRQVIGGPNADRRPSSLPDGGRCRWACGRRAQPEGTSSSGICTRASPSATALERVVRCVPDDRRGDDRSHEQAVAPAPWASRFAETGSLVVRPIRHAAVEALLGLLVILPAANRRWASESTRASISSLPARVRRPRFPLRNPSLS